MINMLRDLKLGDCRLIIVSKKLKNEKHFVQNLIINVWAFDVWLMLFLREKEKLLNFVGNWKPWICCNFLLSLFCSIVFCLVAFRFAFFSHIMSKKNNLSCHLVRRLMESVTIFSFFSMSSVEMMQKNEFLLLLRKKCP